MKHEARRRGSALHRSLIGDDYQYEWDLVAQLLAIIADGIHTGNAQFARVNAKNPSSVKAPAPIPRPGVKGGPRKVGGDTVVSLDEARRLFRRHNPSAFRALADGPDVSGELVGGSEVAAVDLDGPGELGA